MGLPNEKAQPLRPRAGEAQAKPAEVAVGWSEMLGPSFTYKLLNLLNNYR